MSEPGDIALEEALIETTIVPYLRWVAKDVLHRKRTRLEGPSGIVGATSGVLSTGVAAFLGHDFGRFLAQSAGWDPLAQEALGLIVGGIAPLPIAVLTGRTSYNVFSKMAISTSEREKQITAISICGVKAIKLAYGAYVWTIAVLTASASTYNTYQELSGKMGLWYLLFAIPDFISPTILSRWAYNNLNKHIYASCRRVYYERLTADERASVNRLRFQLQEKLQASMRTIHNMDDALIDALYARVMTEAAPLLESDLEDYGGYHGAVEALFCLEGTELVLPSVEKESWWQRAFSVLGGFIGAFSAAAYLPLAEKAADMFWLLCQSEIMLQLCKEPTDDQRSISHAIFGGAALLCRGSLAIYATTVSFGKFFRWFSELPAYTKNSLKKIYSCLGGHSDDSAHEMCHSYYEAGLTSLALIVALISTSVRGEVVLQNFDTEDPFGKFLLACAIIGPFSTRYWALDHFVVEKTSHRRKRNELTGHIQVMHNKVSSLDKKFLSRLYEEFVENTDSGDEEVVFSLLNQG